jgi:hypothetical protein
MEFLDRTYTVFTLVDITNTGIIRDLPGQELQRNQQRNWETVLQCIGLITQPNVISGPMVKEVDDIKDWGFGEMYTGRNKVWTFSFNVEREDVFQRGTENLALLEESFDQVPVVTYLAETAKFLLPIFYSHGAIKNICFKNSISLLNK